MAAEPCSNNCESFCDSESLQPQFHNLPSSSSFSQGYKLSVEFALSLCRVSATNDEEAAAKVAAANANSGAPTMTSFSPCFRFDKIIAKEIPSSIVYEDDKVLAFRDINPQAPVHVLVIPKFRDGLTELRKAELRHVEILGQLLHAAKIVAEIEGILDGFRVVINNGPAACKPLFVYAETWFCIAYETM
ncbi:HISTIDINE TRIAD NUCLEOTIDE-BINDING 2 [Prunus dulcis]|uniref:HISTIDINE TRIAD NUCLEOTIDE-BINDING 2 n=1 Tax=Prunus dulcis TaxID=3755 RepID=A0A4Y1RAT8_PRUDU|nr:HISTIDINE TRIAD NUCLEOTIDE-BINDING 2 [Prunus dulcis]